MHIPEGADGRTTLFTLIIEHINTETFIVRSVLGGPKYTPIPCSRLNSRHTPRFTFFFLLVYSSPKESTQPITQLRIIFITWRLEGSGIFGWLIAKNKAVAFSVRSV